MFGWGDFVVLRECHPYTPSIEMLTFRSTVRFNALSRAIESALQKEGILSRVLGGHKFFERAEVRHSLLVLVFDILANWNDFSHRSRIFWHICKLSTTPTSFRDFRGRSTRQIEVSGKRLLVNSIYGSLSIVVNE